MELLICDICGEPIQEGENTYITGSDPNTSASHVGCARDRDEAAELERQDFGDWGDNDV